MIKKQRILIIALAAAFVLLTCIYFFVLKPLLNDPSEDEIPTLSDGEVLGPGNSIVMFERVQRENIKRIEVNNRFGSYAFYYDTDRKDFYLENNINAPYSKEQLASLMTAAGYTRTMMRVTENCENMAEYGLSDSDSPAYYVLEKGDGTTYKVYIGRAIPTGAGYYVRLEGRNAVYILDSSISDTLLSSVTAMIEPILVFPPSQNNYYTVKNFTITKNKEKVISLTSDTEKAKDESGKEYEEFIKYRITYPEDYTEYRVATAYDEILQSFMDSFSGTQVVALGEPNKGFTDETLEQFGLKEPAYELYFEFNGLKNSLIFSTKNEDGTYFVYSLMFNTICKIDSANASFLDRKVLDYIDKTLIYEDINDVDSIRVTSGDFDETFVLYKGEEIKQQNGTTKTDINVKLKSSGVYLTDTKNFRQYYMSLLVFNLVTYADTTDPEGLECIATLTLNMRDGRTIDLAFYPYASRRCLYTLNGQGHFYVMRDSVERIVDNAKKVINGIPVDYQSK